MARVSWNVGFGLALPAIGGGVCLWMLRTEPPSMILLVVVSGALFALFGVFMATGRDKQTLGLRLGTYAAAAAALGGAAWIEVVAPTLAAGSIEPALQRLSRGRVVDLVVMVASAVGVVLAALVWLEVMLYWMRSWDRGRRRRRAESELYGKADFLDRRFMGELTKRRGILLGQWGSGRSAPLIGWNLEGSAITLAPPRSGKGATIALNYLSPGWRGWPGSTVLLDPRGEVFCVVARRRRQMGRRVLLMDPFGVVRKHSEGVPGLHLPVVGSETFNPLDFIRDDERHAVEDIFVLLDALLTPPSNSQSNAEHFYQSSRAIIAGYLAWVRFKVEPEGRTLGRVRDLLMLSAEERSKFELEVLKQDRFVGGLAHEAVERQRQVGEDERGSNFSSIANQLSFLGLPDMVESTSRSSFDPTVLVDGNTDLFVVVSEDMVKHVRPWMRLWITVPNALSTRRPLERDLLLIIDEMPRLGFLQPVMDGYNMAAGRGVHFWSFAQSLSALDETWGQDSRKTLTHLAEIVQYLGVSRMDVDGAEEISKAIGTATYESQSENRSGTMSDARLIASKTQSQAGETLSLVRERLVTPDELMTLGPDKQFVIARPKDIPRDPIALDHTHYWNHRATRNLWDPNPLIMAKTGSSGADWVSGAVQ